MTKSGWQSQRCLWRNVALALTMLLPATFAFAQVLKRPHDDTQTPDQNQTKINAKKPKQYPWAIAVIEFLPGGATRLVPVALWIDDHFYDASLYGANPEPMAVQPATVYEATAYGEPLGLFTVTTPQEMKGNWIASGSWKPHQVFDEKLAQDAAKKPKPKPADDFDSGRPTLHRAGSSGSSSNSNGSSGGAASTDSASSGGTPAAAEDDPNRPILKKPVQSSPDSSSPSSSTSQASSPAAQAGPSATQTAQAAPPATDENDPNRPVLRRGKPEQTVGAQARPGAANANSAPSSSAKAAPGTPPAQSPSLGARKSFPAVSDAGTFETRSLMYAMNPQERASKSDQLGGLALDEIRKFVAARHGPALPKTAMIRDSDLRAYDLDYTNTPTLVYTGALTVPGAKAFQGGEFQYFVTFVAREDFNGAAIKIFSSVTDSNHLDAFPRMEIIDAVNADKNGRGDLLFRQYSDTGISYSLYRVFPYDLQKIFEGGSGV